MNLVLSHVMRTVCMCMGCIVLGMMILGGRGWNWSDAGRGFTAVGEDLHRNVLGAVIEKVLHERYGKEANVTVSTMGQFISVSEDDPSVDVLYFNFTLQSSVAFSSHLITPSNPLEACQVFEKALRDPKSIECNAIHPKSISRHFNISSPLPLPKPASILVLSQSPILSPSGRLKHNGVIYSPSSHCFHKSFPPVFNSSFHLSKVEDPVFVLSQFGGKAYFHCFIENAIRLFPFIDELKANPSIRLHYIQTEGSCMPQVLDFIGIDRNRLVSGYVTAPVVLFPDTTERCASPSIVQVHRMQSELKLIVENKFSNTLKEKKHILIIQRQSRRRILNRNELIDSLIERFPHETFKIFTDPVPSFETTSKLFHNAKIIIGAHGAGLSNIVFAPRGAVVIEIHPQKERSLITCFIQLSEKLGLHHFSVLSRIGSRNSFLIAPVDLISEIVASNLEILSMMHDCGNVGDFYDPRNPIFHGKVRTVRYKGEPIEEFTRKIISTSQPALIKGFRPFPQMLEWNPEYIEKSCWDSTFKAVFSRNDSSTFLYHHTDPEMFPLTKIDSNRIKRLTKHISHMPAKEFFEKMRKTEKQMSHTEKLYLSAPMASLCKKRFINQIRDYSPFLSVKGTDPEWNMWIGTKGNIASTHYDVTDNFFFQLHGSKKFYISPPQHFYDMHTFPRMHPSDRQSQIIWDDFGRDLESFEKLLETFPNYDQVSIDTAVLGPGDILFLPSLWFHRVEAISSISVSVSMWSDPQEMITGMSFLENPALYTDPLDVPKSKPGDMLFLETLLRELVALSLDHDRGKIRRFQDHLLNERVSRFVKGLERKTVICPEEYLQSQENRRIHGYSIEDLIALIENGRKGALGMYENKLSMMREMSRIMFLGVAVEMISNTFYESPDTAAQHMKYCVFHIQD